nr:type II secretion system protein GspC [uncultured Tolumonas sp.]
MRLLAIQHWILGERGLVLLQRSVVLVLLLGGSYQLAQLSWRLLPAPKSATSASISPKQSVQPDVNATNQQQRLSIIRDAKLFGAAVEDTTPTTAPKSRLNAQLTGIMASSIASRSIAIIARDGKQQSYVIGDVIQGTDAQIINILPDRVIIKRQQQQEALLLDENPMTAPTTTPTLNNSSLPNVRQQLLKNPGQLMDYLTIAPVRENNQLKGYRLNPGRNPEIFNQLGLQPNDLAISINGLDLRNNAEATQAMQQLAHQTEMNISVERNGETQDIYVNLAQP